MSAADSLTSPVEVSDFAYVVGVDIGSQHAVYCVCQPDKRQIVKPTELANSRAGFEALDRSLRQLGVPPARILIGLEATGRYSENLYQFLQQQGYCLCLLHPRQTHQFAKQRGLRAKTDRLDAITIARLLLSGEARPGYVPDEVIATYRELARLHSQLTDDSARYQNEIQALVVVLFPEFVQVFADPCRPTALALLKRYPSAQAFVEASVEAVAATLRQLAPRHYGRKTAQQLVCLARQSAGSLLATGARALSLQILCDQLQHTLANLAQVESELDHVLDRDTGATGLKSTPEFGRKTVAVLRAELGDVTRYEPRRSGRGLCRPGPGGQAKWQMARANQALQTRQRARAARPLHGCPALHLPARLGFRGLLPAPGGPRPQSPRCLDGCHAQNADRRLSFTALQ